MTNLEKYKNDLKKLISFGDALYDAIQYECFPENFTTQIKKIFKDEAEPFIKSIPSFINKYQSWYSESLSIIKLLLPDRINDFVRLYEKPKRKEITNDSYVIEDYLHGISVTRGLDEIAGPKAAVTKFKQQLNILKSVEKRFDSSLFDIKILIQSDLFDSELKAARELNKNGFIRAAGAMTGVVLEKHLSQVCGNHKISIANKKSTINDYNQALKDNSVIDLPSWRFILHLGDLRNLCDHDKKNEPTKDQIEDLIIGVEKITKTIS